MSASDTVEHEILVRYFSGPVWVALYSHDPVEPGTAEEAALPAVAGASVPVVPAQIGPRVAVLLTIEDNVARSTDEIIWNTLPPGLAVEAVGLWTAETEGTLLFHGRLTYRRLTEAGVPFRFLPGALSVSVD